LVEGRWLLPDDQNALVVNTEFLKDQPDLNVGDQVTLKIDDRETTWQIVGVVTSQVIGDGSLLAPLAYAKHAYLEQLIRQPGLTKRVLIETASHEPVFREDLARTINRDLERAGVGVEQVQTFHTLLNGLLQTINVIIYLLIAMALLFASIGALSLTGMMSLNVLERTQEIGILRSIGATSRIVRQIVIVEGVTVGLFSWLLGALLSIPVSRVLGHTLGLVLLSKPLEPTLPLTGVLLWLVIIVLLSVLASIIPARQASLLSIREVLAYE
jgi:putative ABC transport system permease protein